MAATLAHQRIAAKRAALLAGRQWHVLAEGRCKHLLGVQRALCVGWRATDAGLSTQSKDVLFCMLLMLHNATCLPRGVAQLQLLLHRLGAAAKTAAGCVPGKLCQHQVWRQARRAHARDVAHDHGAAGPGAAALQRALHEIQLCAVAVALVAERDI